MAQDGRGVNAGTGHSEARQRGPAGLEGGGGDMQRIVTVPSQKQCHSDDRMGYVALALVMCVEAQFELEQIGNNVVDGGDARAANGADSRHRYCTYVGQIMALPNSW